MLACHWNALAKVPERTDERPWKGTGRAPEGFLKGRGTGTRRVSSRQRPPLPLSLPSSPPPTTHHHHHLRIHFSSRSTRIVSLIETPVGRCRSDDSVFGQSTRDSPSRWHWPRRSTTAPTTIRHVQKTTTHRLFLHPLPQPSTTTTTTPQAHPPSPLLHHTTTSTTTTSQPPPFHHTTTTTTTSSLPPSLVTPPPCFLLTPTSLSLPSSPPSPPPPPLPPSPPSSPSHLLFLPLSQKVTQCNGFL